MKIADEEPKPSNLLEELFAARTELLDAEHELKVKAVKYVGMLVSKEIRMDMNKTMDRYAKALFRWDALSRKTRTY